MKERVLKLTLEEAVDLFASRKWNFFEIRERPQTVRLDAPVGPGETYVVELPYHDEKELDRIRQTLVERGFLEQEVRVTPE
jgi:hypothetical protein